MHPPSAAHARAQARDSLKLWHVWLAKRELETRRVKSRPFTGINPAALDLRTDRPGAATPPQEAATQGAVAHGPVVADLVVAELPAAAPLVAEEPVARGA
jgi:hypothetical protein